MRLLEYGYNNKEGIPDEKSWTGADAQGRGGVSGGEDRKSVV